MTSWIRCAENIATQRLKTISIKPFDQQKRLPGPAAPQLTKLNEELPDELPLLTEVLHTEGLSITTNNLT